MSADIRINSMESKTDPIKMAGSKLGHSKPKPMPMPDKPKEETKSASAGKKKKISIRISPTDNDGYMVNHEGEEPQVHGYPDIAGVHGHLDKTYGKAGSGWENTRSDKEALPEGKPAAGGPETKD
jgi:hypothetical protein